jgi:hypothetical protein
MNSIDYLSEILTEEQIKKLESIGYFTSPASSKHHLAVKGGLQQHSVNVTETMLKINESMNLGLDRKEIITTGMLHDLCKCGCYKENILKSGLQSEAQPYTFEKAVDLGHGSESLYLINNELNMQVSANVAQAIYWHMGFDYSKDNYSIETIKRQPLGIMYVWLMQTADLYATWIMEGKYE